MYTRVKTLRPQKLSLSAVGLVIALALFQPPTYAQVNIIDAFSQRRSDIYLVNAEDGIAYRALNYQRRSGGGVNFDCEPITQKTEDTSCFGSIALSGMSDGNAGMKVSVVEFRKNCTIQSDKHYSIGSLSGRNSWTMTLNSSECRILDGCLGYAGCRPNRDFKTLRVVLGKDRALAIASGQ